MSTSDFTSDVSSASFDVYHQPWLGVNHRNQRTSYSIAMQPTIVDYNDLIEQPPNIVVPLKNHQKASLKRMIWMETNKLFPITPESPEYTADEHITSLSTTVGFLCDQVGSGKSLTMISLATLTHEIPDRDHDIQVHKEKTFYTRSNHVTFNDVDCNLIIIPHTIVDQWTKYLQTQTINVSFKIISRMKHVPETQEKMMEMFSDVEIIVVTSNFYMCLKPYIKDLNLRCKRVIIDEADVIEIKKYSSQQLVPAKFTWLITASVNNLFGYCANRVVYNRLPYSEKAKYWHSYNFGNLRTYTGQMVENAMFELQTFRKALIIQNDPELIRLSMMIPNYETFLIRLKNIGLINAVKGLLDASVMEMIYAGDIENAVKSMQMGEYTTSGLLDAVSTNFNMNLENLRLELQMCETYHYASAEYRQEAIQRVQKKIEKVELDILSLKDRLEDSSMCAICYDDIKERTILTCCHKSYCLICISQCLSRKSECPYCRKKVNLSELIHVNDEMDLVKEVEEDKKMVFNTFQEELQSLRNKSDVILRIMQHNPTGEKRKFVISSLYDNSFGSVLEKLKLNKIHHEVLNGSGAHISNVLNRCRQSDETNVILLNAKNMGYGLNIEFGTDLILCHRLKGDVRNQVIGRLQRFGREQPLRIWEVVFENEMA